MTPSAAAGPARPDPRTVFPFVAGLASFALLAAFDHARGFELWRNYALSGILLGGPTTWVLWRLDVRVPHYIQWMIVGATLLHYGGGSVGSPDRYQMGLFGMHGVNGAYHVFGWWDNLTHGMGIGAGAMGFSYLLEGFQLRRRLAWPAWLVATTALLAALAAGVGVELYEYLGKTLFQTIDQGGYVNTMTDLQFNLLGAAVGAVLATAVQRLRRWDAVQALWGSQAAGPWRIPAPMVGVLAFVAVPAGVSLALASAFAWSGPVEWPGAYDRSLRLLAGSALAGILAAPLATAVARQASRQEALA